MQRSEKARVKVERMNKALRHKEGDRVPVSDSLWSSFVRLWRALRCFPLNSLRYWFLDCISSLSM